jgi:hypothetical protein
VQPGGQVIGALSLQTLLGGLVAELLDVLAREGLALRVLGGLVGPFGLVRFGGLVGFDGLVGHADSLSALRIGR